jgi:hypothetical protein
LYFLKGHRFSYADELQKFLPDYGPGGGVLAEPVDDPVAPEVECWKLFAAAEYFLIRRCRKLYLQCLISSHTPEADSQRVSLFTEIHGKIPKVNTRGVSVSERSFAC